MWHLCSDNRWTYTSNINIDPQSIPFFLKPSTIDCIICAYSDHLFISNESNDSNNDLSKQSSDSQDSCDRNSENVTPKFDFKSLTKFVKRIQTYDNKYTPKQKLDPQFKTNVKVETARINVVDKDRFDITRKSAGRLGLIFAPSWEIINKVKKEEISFDTYKLLYIEEMKKSYVENNIAWFNLLIKDRIVLVCYCTDHEKCHRTILARDILTTYGAKYIGEVKLDSSDLSDSSASSEFQDSKNSSKSKKSKKSSGNGQGSLF